MSPLPRSTSRWAAPHGYAELAVVRREDRETGHQHGGIAAGHREPAVVGPLRHDQAERVLLVPRVTRQCTVRIAGEYEVSTIGKELSGETDAREAFRAVAGASERDQKRWEIAREVLQRIGRQIRRAHGVDADRRRHGILPPEPCGDAFRGMRGRAGPAQHNTQVRRRQRRCKPRVDHVSRRLDLPAGPPPDLGLLTDLARRPVAAGTLELRRLDLKELIHGTVRLAMFALSPPISMPRHAAEYIDVTSITR